MQIFVYNNDYKLIQLTSFFRVYFTARVLVVCFKLCWDVNGIQDMWSSSTVDSFGTKKRPRKVVFLFMEATLGIEPRNGSFADSCLTAWLCRHYFLVLKFFEILCFFEFHTKSFTTSKLVLWSIQEPCLSWILPLKV